MASDNKSGGDGRQPLPPAVRRRLQMSFEHATKCAAGGDFKYATESFTQCVIGDPANPIYATQFLNNLAKLYKDNKKGAGFTSAPKLNLLKTSIKKANYSKDWKSLMATAIEALKINPWDVSTLSAMAAACEELHMDETQLVYLKRALDVNPKDVDVNRLCGRALARMGQFDQAIACWHRVEQAKPGDEEAGRAIGELAIEKTIRQGGYEEAENSTDVMANKAAQADRRTDAAARLTPEQTLEKAIAKKPDDVSNYVELADLHSREERFKEAIEVLSRAVEVSGGEISIKERLEDAQLRQGRHQLQIAEKKAASEKTPEAVDLAKRMKAELNSVEMGYYRARGERYPNNAGHKFELGLRLKRAGQYNEAINCFQRAGDDPKRKAGVHLELGECFQYIKQYKLAMTNYEAALGVIPAREVDQRKLALYRAGKLALGLGEKYLASNAAQGNEEIDRAEKYLNELAGMEFGYKDVPQLLDKISKIRHKG